MIGLILAAGYGTRLYPLTEQTPKALLPVKGRPILDYLVEKCLAPSVAPREVVLVSNHRYAKEFEKWFSNARPPIPWTLLDDGSTSEENRLGSIGDLVFAIRTRALQEDLLVIGGDNLFQDDLKEFCAFAREKKPGIILGAYEVPNRTCACRYGVLTVDRDHRVLKLDEKPQKPSSSLVSTAVYFFPAQQLHWVLEYSGSTDTLGAFLHWLVPQEAIFAYRFHGLWFDIGDLSSYKNAEESFLP